MNGLIQEQHHHAYRFLGGAKHELFSQLSLLIEKYSVCINRKFKSFYNYYLLSLLENSPTLKF